MSKIKFDQIGQRKFKIGCDHGVIYPQRKGTYPKGAAWNGLTNVTKSPSGAEVTKYYADNMQYFNMISAETLGLTIECFMYPDEFEECNGEAELAEGVRIGQQSRNTFGFAYRNKLGNDTDGEDHGFEINVIYGCTASPSEQANGTINESPEPGTMSYEVNTTPVPVSGLAPNGKPYKPTACVTFDSTKLSRDVMLKVEEILYGTDNIYGITTDTEFTDGKDYYELIDGEYTKVTPPTGSDKSFPDGVEYYEITTAGTDGRLPFPDEWKKILASG